MGRMELPYGSVRQVLDEVNPPEWMTRVVCSGGFLYCTFIQKRFKIRTDFELFYNNITWYIEFKG